uniref:F-box domain-containing protein n=1 Tax=Kalanchoe fedtschenkoi TaxID=63787 RepID=A0A7N0TDU7_KALFE
MSTGKRPRSGEGDVDGDRSGGGWEDLSPEILASIFVRLPVEKMMQAVPMVCRSWYEVVLGPYCWREIDIDRWCRFTRKPQMIDSVVTRLVRRSRCTIVRLSGARFGDPSFAIASSWYVLHPDTMTGLVKLELAYSRMGSLGLRALLKKCEGLTHFDIQGCRNIQQLDDDTEKKCQRLVEFKSPWFYDSDFLYSADDEDGAEASSSDTSS